MKISQAQTLTALIFLLAAATLGQQRPSKTNPAAPCGERSAGIPDFYYEAVVANFIPPDFRRSVIRIAEGGEIKIVLVTNGTSFELWTDTPETPQRSVNKFLLQLDDSCRLPPDPGDAAKLIKVKWESRALSQEQFAKLQRGFTGALSQYVADAQNRYGSSIDSHMVPIYLDAIRYPISYDNHQEHVEVYVWDNPKEDGPMVEWVHQLKKLAEYSFRRPFLTANE